MIPTDPKTVERTMIKVRRGVAPCSEEAGILEAGLKGPKSFAGIVAIALDLRVVDSAVGVSAEDVDESVNVDLVGYETSSVVVGNEDEDVSCSEEVVGTNGGADTVLWETGGPSRSSPFFPPSNLKGEGSFGAGRSPRR